MPVRIRIGSVERRVIISGRPRDADLNRIIDVDLRPVVLPETGLAISSMLAQILGVEGREIRSRSTCSTARAERYLCR